MAIKRTNYLNLYALLEAEMNNEFNEQLALQRSNKSSSGISTEEYCREFVKIQKKSTLDISVDDVTRKEFHTNY
jgi:hypothetical protein